MQKRGQVSVFIIIGVVAIFAVMFVFLLVRSFQDKAREITNPQEYLKSQLMDVKKAVDRCITDESKKALNKLSWQGGHFNPVRYVTYNGNKTSVLCAKIVSDRPCFNMMFTKSNIDVQLQPFLERNVKSCMDDSFEAFRNKDYELTTGVFNLNSEFSDTALLVRVNYPVTLTKGLNTQKQNEFSKETKTNFWKAVSLASAIINKEATGNPVDVAVLSSSNILFEIGRTEINNDDLYLLKSRTTTDPIFYFVVET